MIQIRGKTFEQISSLPADNVERIIIQRMHESSVVYSYSSIEELSFELKLRKNIIMSARAMNQSDVKFAIFANSQCNPKFWDLTNVGGFQLRPGVRPSDAIQDIYENSSLYAFECATAKIIIYYHAVLKSMGDDLFNQYFQNLYLYSWHFDPDLQIKAIPLEQFLPGDVVYFNNPDVDPETPWWRGENAVALEDDTFFGHGLGIRTSEQMIQELNKRRKPDSNQSAYLLDQVTRPNFIHLAKLSLSPQRFAFNKIQHIVIWHNESSISCYQYLTYLNKVYSLR
jgi:protein-glutamine gamma-glutamyltransferase